MTFHRFFAIARCVAVALLAVGFAASAHAGTQMYTGSLIIEAFGNDTTTGNQPPFQSARHVGIPLTGNCNTQPFHAKETLQFPPGGPYTVTFTVPTYGGAAGTPNNPPAGCGDPTIRAGDPLTASGSIVTTGTTAPRTTMDPRKFTIAKSALSWTGSGASFEAYGIYRWEVHRGDLKNDTGVFSKSGGDGSFGFLYGPPGNPDRRITQTAGNNQFGGVMRLLGSYGDNEGYYFAPGNVTSVFYIPEWKFEYHGHGGQPTVAGVVTAGYAASGTAFGFTRDSGSSVTSMVYAKAFEWTTGMVTVEANQGTFPTHQAMTGYDNRNAAGSGMIQLVSPMLTHWVGAGETSTASIAILKINFTPEPSEWMMLAGGVSMLGLLFYTRRSRN